MPYVPPEVWILLPNTALNKSNEYSKASIFTCAEQHDSHGILQTKQANAFSCSQL